MEVKSIIVQGVEDVEIVQEFIDDKSLKDHEVYVENYFSHISPGTELSRVYGYKKGATYPFRVGYSSVGKILAKGPAVKDLEIGDFVLHSGSHSSYTIYNAAKSDGGVLYKLPENLPLDQACCLVLCGVAACGILIADVKVKDTVAIFGLGVLGSILSILYKQAGVKLIGVDPLAARAKDLPLDLYVSDLANAEQEIMAFTNGKGVDIAVDASGQSPAICSAIAVTRNYGQVVLLGSPRHSYETDITPAFNAIHMKNLKVLGALNRLFPFNQHIGSITNVKENLDYLSSLMLQGIIDTKKIVSHVIKPEEAMSAYRGLMYDRENYIGVIIDWKNND